MKQETMKAIEHAINCNSEENVSDTPDFVLAEFLDRCLDAWNKGTRTRDNWLGRPCGGGQAVLLRLPGQAAAAAVGAMLARLGQQRIDLTEAELLRAPQPHQVWFTKNIDGTTTVEIRPDGVTPCPIP
jgi:hypothetical protein